MSTTRTACLALAVAGTVALTAQSPQERGSHTHGVIVTVLDKSGKPATGLGPADFKVRENDMAREILDVGPATGPMSIALLYDTSDPTQAIVLETRKSLQGFAHAVLERSPDSQIELMSFGERPTKEAPFTNSAMTLDRTLQRIFARPGAGAYLLEAILEAAGDLKKAHATRPIIAAFVNERAVEFSSDPHERVADTLRDGGVALWAIVLQGTGGRGDESRNRSVVLGDVTTASGGTRETVLSRAGLEPGFAQLADRLTSQYLITYSRPDSLIPPDKIEVTLQREGLRLLAPRWTGR